MESAGEESIKRRPPSDGTDAPRGLTPSDGRLGAERIKERRSGVRVAGTREQPAGERALIGGKRGGARHIAERFLRIHAGAEERIESLLGVLTELLGERGDALPQTGEER